MNDHEKPLWQEAAEAEARGEKWFDEDEDAQKIAETEAKAPAAALPAPAAAPADPRYQFPVPQMAIFDLLGIQLAECTRMARVISDDVVDGRIEHSDRNRTIHAFQDVVQSAAVIADTMDLVQNGKPRIIQAPRRSGRS